MTGRANTCFLASAASVSYVSCLISVRTAALPPLCIIQGCGTSGANVFCLFLRNSCSVVGVSIGSNCPYLTTHSHCLVLFFASCIQLFMFVLSDCVFVKHSSFFIRALWSKSTLLGYNNNNNNNNTHSNFPYLRRTTAIYNIHPNN